VCVCACVRVCACACARALHFALSCWECMSRLMRVEVLLYVELVARVVTARDSDVHSSGVDGVADPAVLQSTLSLCRRLQLTLVSVDDLWAEFPGANPHAAAVTLPTHTLTTNPAYGYVRVHRRVGADRVLLGGQSLPLLVCCAFVWTSHAGRVSMACSGDGTLGAARAQDRGGGAWSRVLHVGDRPRRPAVSKRHLICNARHGPAVRLAHALPIRSCQQQVVTDVVLQEPGQGTGSRDSCQRHATPFHP
jgi:hypothetical protein